MGTLAKELQKYYARKGNKILFRNGMSLNQLALEMWERLGYREIDSSVLSRVLKGERLFESKQLNIFSDILGLSKKERELLKETLFEDAFDKFGFDDSFLQLKHRYFFELVEENLNKISEVKLKSLPMLAENWAFALLEKLEDRIATNHSEEFRNRTLGLKAKILKEILEVQLAAEPLETMREAVTRSTSEMEKVGKTLKNKYFFGLASYLHGNMINIINGDNKTAVMLLKKGIDVGLVGFDEAAAYRALAVSYANLHEEVHFEEIRKKLIALSIEYPQHKDYILEGTARGEAILGKIQSARKTVSHAWETHNKDKHSFMHELREIETVRTETEIAAKSKEKKYGISERSIKRAIQMSRELGYTRMEQQIERFKYVVDTAG